MNQKRILVVDDEEDIVKTIKISLEIEGYEVIEALDGNEALDKARSENPDLIILDIMLPIIDGYEVARKLKYDDKYKHIPILMLTALTQKREQEMGLEAGADFYMTKPFDQDALNNKIKELLSKNQYK